MTSLLSLRDVSVAVGPRTILSAATLDVSAGEFVAVVGPNGAGKSTLLRAAAGLIAATGEVSLLGDALAGIALSERARRVAYLPQGHTFHWPLSVRDVVGLGRLPRGAGADLSEADVSAVDEALAATGTMEYADRSVTTLSGGERARVALARVLATEAPVILADEPTASLDLRYQFAVIDILRRHASASGAVVAVVHDLSLAARAADRVVMMDEGKLLAEGRPESVLTAERIGAVFGVAVSVTKIEGALVITPTREGGFR